MAAPVSGIVTAFAFAIAVISVTAFVFVIAFTFGGGGSPFSCYAVWEPYHIVVCR